MTMGYKMEPWGLPLAKVATNVGTAAGVLTAGSIEVTQMLGYTLEQWQMFAIIIAAITGLGGLLATVVFKTLHYRLARKKANEQKQ